MADRRRGLDQVKEAHAPEPLRSHHHPAPRRRELEHPRCRKPLFPHELSALQVPDAERDVLAAGDENAVVGRLRRFRDAGVTDLSVRVLPLGADRAAIHLDKLSVLREDATRERLAGAERAAEAVRETWRALEEFNLAPHLAFEALFVRIARELPV